MFEEEAEDYGLNNYEMCSYQDLPYASDRQARIQAFKDGADFGYNKANEWHEVKDKGLPKNNNDGATYLLFTVYGRGGSPVVAHFKERDSQLLMNTWTGAILTEDKIVSWKEFVFPKE